ncbi:MAG TPA: right-handed parallel beta-helix repeat-containing protein, partial [Anaerovoracaceae bacterium]|nr:right-handed parallel beta-helix repeat-containing protein [Anaerovoracaceae bacterium]
TEKQPWRSIQKAAESATPGSTVQIKAGTYYERINIKVSGTSAEKPIIFKNYENDKVIIDGSKSSASTQEDLIHISNQSFVKLIGLEILNNTNKDKDYFVTGIGIWGKGEGIEIRNCKIHQIWYTGSSGDSGAQAIAVNGSHDTEPISGLVIDGNEIWDIKCGRSETVALNGNVDRFEFTNNYVHDTDNIGLILTGDVRNGFVGQNKMERNSFETNPNYTKDDYSAGGIYADGAKDTTIAYNTCTGNDIGIKVGNETRNKECKGIIVRDNLFYGNKTSGIQVGGYDVNKGGAVDCQFLNNTLYNNNTKKQGRGEINIAKSHDLLFSSNIIYTGAQNLAVSTEDFGAKNIYNINFNHNIYYGPGGARGLRFTGVDTGLVGLNMWKSKTKQDGSSRIADPKFADSEKGDFRLVSYSPAIDFGNPAYIIEEDEKDFGGSLRINGKAIDCGIYEF